MTGIADRPAPARPHRSGTGFTLVELLVVVAVIGILLGVLLPALSHAHKCAVISGELSAGRQFITAHLMYTNDYTGRVPVGFASNAMMTSGQVVARNNRGERLVGLEGRRYPWRLLPFLEYELGILYRDRAAIESQLTGTSYDYAVSAAPRFGLNQAFIGGSGDSDITGKAFVASAVIRNRIEKAWGSRWYVNRVSDARQASNLIVFASSFGSDPFSGIELDGMYRVTPPRFDRELWAQSEPNESSLPASTGNVSFRFSGRTVASMLDGHAETMNWAKCKDMRHWAPGADSESWQLPPY